MIRWVKGAKPGKASVKQKCEPEEVHNIYLLFGLVKMVSGCSGPKVVPAPSRFGPNRSGPS